MKKIIAVILVMILAISMFTGCENIKGTITEFFDLTPKDELILTPATTNDEIRAIMYSNNGEILSKNKETNYIDVKDSNGSIMLSFFMRDADNVRSTIDGQRHKIKVLKKYTDGENGLVYTVYSLSDVKGETVYVAAWIVGSNTGFVGNAPGGYERCMNALDNLEFQVKTTTQQDPTYYPDVVIIKK